MHLRKNFLMEETWAIHGEMWTTSGSYGTELMLTSYTSVVCFKPYLVSLKYNISPKIFATFAPFRFILLILEIKDT